MTLLTPLGFPEERWPRIGATVRRLAQLIWREEGDGLEVHATEPTRELLPFEAGTGRPLAPLGPPPIFWGRLFDQRWCRIRLPKPAQEGDWLSWRGQGETTVYIDGAPIGGTDAGRSRVRVPAGAQELWIEWVCENVGILLDEHSETLDPNGCRFDGAFLARRDDAAWRCHTDLALLSELLDIEYRKTSTEPPPPVPWGPRPELNRATPLFRVLLDRLSEAVDVFDREGLEALGSALDQTRRDIAGAEPFMAATLTGHAHIDLVWRWPERTGVFKAVHTFANVLTLMERDPSFVFGYSQPASYEAAGGHAPAVLERVRQRIAEGRWEACGMLHVESDTQLPCGEALARSFLLGQRGFERLTGKPSRVLWLPDAFGFAGCVPQLVRESGGESFFTTKVHWSNVNRFPHSAFVWRGQDGSEITGFVPGDFDYNGDASARRLHEAANQQRQAGVFPETLIPTGHGDGGGGPTEEMCRRAEVLRDLAGMPRTAWGRIDDFFERLRVQRERLPVWDGEIYLEYHRGVHTTGRRLKWAFRAAERALQTAEAVAVVRGTGPIDEAGWKRLVFTQFHDAVPGSSCGEVYAETIPELERIAASALEDAQARLSGNGPASLFNPLPVPRSIAAEGEMHQLRPLEGRPMAESRIDEPGHATADERSLHSDRVRAELDARGLIRALEIDGRHVRLSAPAGDVLAFADRPHAFEAWDIDRASLEHALQTDESVAVSIEASGGIEAAVVVKSGIARAGRLTKRYRLIAGEPALRIEYEIDLDEPDVLLKAVFPTSYAGQSARFGAPFGSAMRGQRPGARRDEAAFEVPGSRWASVTDDAQREGFAVMTDSSYGFGCQSGMLHVSLLRTALVTSTGLEPALRREDAGPAHFDLGRSSVQLAVGLAGGDVPASQQPASLAETLFTPAIRYEGPPVSSPLLDIEQDPGVVAAWAKPAESAERAWVLRLHETLGSRAATRLTLAEGWLARPVDLRERPAGDALPPDGNAVTVTLRPCSFASVLLEPQ